MDDLRNNLRKDFLSLRGEFLESLFDIKEDSKILLECMDGISDIMDMLLDENNETKRIEK